VVNYTDISFALINRVLEYDFGTMKIVKTCKAKKISASFGQALYCLYDKVRLITKIDEDMQRMNSAGLKLCR